jgi:DNA-binding CsgD family transcriptional regulator
MTARSGAMDAQEEIVRLLAIQLRCQAATQAEAIVEMARAGFGAVRIAELLGTTPNTVSQALQDAKRGAKKAGGSGNKRATSAAK